MSLILGIKFSARGIREFLGTLFKWTTPELKRVSGLKLSSWHWGIVFTKEHLLHLKSARFRTSVLDILAHFIWTHPLQRLQFIQSINPEGFSHFGALQVSLFFITTQPQYLTNCRNTTFGCVPINLPEKQSQQWSNPYIKQNLEMLKCNKNGIISPGCDGSFSPSAATNQQNSVREVVQLS